MQSIVLCIMLLTGLVVKKISLFWLMILEVNSSEAICRVVLLAEPWEGREHLLQETETIVVCVSSYCQTSS